MLIVYAIYEGDSDTVRYVGATTRGFAKRTAEHTRAWRSLRSEIWEAKGPLQNWLATQGAEPQFSVLEECGARVELHAAEKRWQDVYADSIVNGHRAGVRLDDVADAERASMRTGQQARRKREREEGTGWRMTEEQRRLSGQKHSAAWWALTDEERAAKIKARPKPVWSEETRQANGEKARRQWKSMSDAERKAWKAKVLSARAKAVIPRSCCVRCGREMQTFQLTQHLGSRKCVQRSTRMVQ